MASKKTDVDKQMTDQHPITPPPELVEQWLESTRSHDCIGAYPANYEQIICTAAARWGADQELEACCADIHTIHGQHRADWLRWMRRPKTPSLKEQGIQAWCRFQMCNHTNANEMNRDFDIVRRALEALPDD